METTYNVYSLGLFKYLIKNGFAEDFYNCKAMEENSGKVFFRFKDTVEIRAAVEEYTIACKKYFGG